MMLVYYEGKGLWFDFPSVDSPKRRKAFNKFRQENMPASGEDHNDDEWNKYNEKLLEWNKNNPTPEFTVNETEITLKRTGYFDRTTPVLDFQPEIAFVNSVFKLNYEDEKRAMVKFGV